MCHVTFPPNSARTEVAESSQLGVLPEQLMEPLRELRVAGGRATGAVEEAPGRLVGGGGGWVRICGSQKPTKSRDKS